MILCHILFGIACIQWHVTLFRDPIQTNPNIVDRDVLQKPNQTNINKYAVIKLGLSEFPLKKIIFSAWLRNVWVFRKVLGKRIKIKNM